MADALKTSDFLGFCIQRQSKRGIGKLTVYTYPTKKAFHSIRAKVWAVTRQRLNHPLGVLLDRLAPILRGRTNYYKHGVSKGDLRLPTPPHLASGAVVDQLQTSPCELEVDPTPLPARVVAHGWQRDIIRPRQGDGQPLPLPGTHMNGPDPF